MIKVIIADDEENVCKLIRGLIDWKSLDMEIMGVAHNGVEALDLIKDISPDLIITDIRMPGYDGLEMIRYAKDIKEDLDFIIISGYRHFEYAQNAIKYGVGDYLLKPINKEDFLVALSKMRERYMQRTEQMSNEEHLKKRLKSDVDKLRANLFIERLLKKGADTEDLTLDNINENYHFSFKSGVFQMCAVKIDCGFECQYNNAIKILGEKVLQILNSLLKEQCYEMGIYSDDSVTYCLLNFHENYKKTMRKQMKVVLDELLIQKAAFEKFEFTIAAGTVVEDVKQLKDTFRAARFGIAQRIISGTGIFIEEGTVKAESQMESALLAELNKKMGTAIELLDKNSVLSCIDSLKIQIKTEKYLKGQEIFSLTRHICEMYLTHLRNNEIPIQYGEEFYEEFCIYSNHCSSIDELFQYLSVMLNKSLDVIIEDKKQTDTKPIRLAKQYIQQNYMKPISLEDISNLVGFNAAYFSTLFKKENGSNYVNYLSEVRMNRAKELLRETNLNIAVVCELVGYNDLKHFTKSFKKNTGIKPNEYRKLYS